MRIVKPPDNPKIYHITHLENLGSIVQHGYIWSERKARDYCPGNKCIGISEIKSRRLNEIEVICHPGTLVGDYAPFYFCPRSIMLYLISKGNHPNLDFKGGQTKVVHLQADLRTVVNWATENGVRWAFTPSNAGAYYVDFFHSMDDLGKIKWVAVEATDWRDPQIKEGKQAEFLLYERLPFELIEHIGVATQSVLDEMLEVLASSHHRPVVNIERGWYY